jgi:hypothetical protein
LASRPQRLPRPAQAKALAKLVRGKLKAMLRRRRPDLVLPPGAWRKPWIVHITSWGEGEQAVLDYLARYVFRVAITNARIVGLDDHAVTIRYKHRKSSAWLTCRIAGDEFVHRFLQHVLPKGFHKGAVLRSVAPSQTRPRRPRPPPPVARSTRLTPERSRLSARARGCLSR